MFQWKLATSPSRTTNVAEDVAVVNKVFEDVANGVVASHNPHGKEVNMEIAEANPSGEARAKTVDTTTFGATTLTTPQMDVLDIVKMVKDEWM